MLGHAVCGKVLPGVLPGLLSRAGGGELSVLLGETTTPGSKTSAELSTEYTSRSFTPGIAGAVTIVGGTYQKNGTGGFVSTPGMALVTDTFEMRGVSPAVYSSTEVPQTTTVTLTINGIGFVYAITCMLEPATNLDDMLVSEIDGMTVAEIDTTPI